jgi:hypothetical protein
MPNLTRSPGSPMQADGVGGTGRGWGAAEQQKGGAGRRRVPSARGMTRSRSASELAGEIVGDGMALVWQGGVGMGGSVLFQSH